MPLSIPEILIAIILSSHLFYQLFFLIGMVRIKRTDHPDNWPGASVVVAARNEYKNLQQLVPSLLEQVYENFEIIIVNDRSDDESFDFLMQLKNNPRVKVVFVDHLPDHVNSKKYALTLGIKAASNDILILTDADCLPASRNWLKGMVSAYEKGTNIVIGYSPYRKEKGFLNSVIRFETHMTGIMYLSAAANKMPYMGVGRNLSYRKEFFLKNKGFNGFQEVTGGDDDLFINKTAGASDVNIALSPDCTTVSIPKRSWKEYLNQKIRHLSVGKYYRNSDKIFTGLFSLLHISSWIAFTIVLIFDFYPLIFGLLFLLSHILFILNFRMLNTKSGTYFSLWVVPFVDFIYGFFYIFVGIRTLFTKKVEWTT